MDTAPSMPIKQPVLRREIGEPRKPQLLEPQSLPWRIIESHAAQAFANTGVTLFELRDRGDLTASEAVAILEDRAWHDMDTAQAFLRLGELVESESKKLPPA